MGDSRKYQYHTTGGILAFQGEGVSWTGILKAWGGGNALWNSECMGGGEWLKSEFLEREDSTGLTVYILADFV